MRIFGVSNQFFLSRIYELETFQSAMRIFGVSNCSLARL